MKKYLWIALAAMALLSCKQRAGETETAEAAEEATKVSVDTTAAKKEGEKLPPEPVFSIITTKGTIKVKLYRDTPLHRDNFKKLALAGYYDSLLIHRVINGFVIQGGDPFTRDTALVSRYGEGGPDYTIPAEILGPDGDTLHRHKRGALAAARRGDIANPFRASSGSQFYIVQNADACRHLDGAYTVFGETVAGFNVIDNIAGVKTDARDRPVRNIRIRHIHLDAEMTRKLYEKELKAKRDAEAAQILQQQSNE